MANNTIWGRLWESTEGDLVTIRLPRALAEELLSAISAGVDGGDGLDMDGDDDDDSDEPFDLDSDDDDGDTDDEDGLDLMLIGGDGDDDEDDKDEAYAKSGGDPSGMRPKTALGEKYMGFDKLKGKLDRQGAKDPGGLAASIGRKKYGKEKFDRAAAKGKKLG